MLTPKTPSQLRALNENLLRMNAEPLWQIYFFYCPARVGHTYTPLAQHRSRKAVLRRSLQPDGLLKLAADFHICPAICSRRRLTAIAQSIAYDASTHSPSMGSDSLSHSSVGDELALLSFNSFLKVGALCVCACCVVLCVFYRRQLTETPSFIEV
jgi:hypothetical protein